MRFHDSSLNNLYANLPDIERWQVTNLFMMNNSPMLWFYIQRQDSNYKRKTESEVCRDFLKTKFNKLSMKFNLFTQEAGGKLQRSNDQVQYPIARKPTIPLMREIYENVSPYMTFGEILSKMGIETSFDSVNEMRLNLATLGFPYLIADPS
ncbi:MAG: hypothetical protein ICV79_06520 [Flavisolibacter sp.]|nr:hypothetical protein [Flavisolibacter sp.]